MVYSLPESLRNERNELRKKLSWLGFGHLVPGTWISPHDRRAEVLAIARKLDVRDYVTLFQGGVTQADEEIVRRCWDVPALAEEYEVFMHRYEPEYHILKANGPSGRQQHSVEEYFKRRFWLTFDYQSFPRQDPNLPRSLLPEGKKSRRPAEPASPYPDG